MPLPMKTSAQYEQELQNLLAANTAGLSNFKTGSVAQAIVLALRGNDLALQQIASAVYDSLRLDSSAGTDVDSWLADFGLSRLLPTAAQGTLVCSRLSTVGTLIVGLGSTAQNSPGDTQYTVIADPTQPAWVPSLNAYVFLANQTQISVTVRATTIGANTGTPANAIQQIVSGFVGVNSVTNPSALIGTDLETDAAAKVRFVAFMSSLYAGTVGAVGYQIRKVAPNVSFQIMEYLHFDMTPFTAGMTIVADNTSGGTPPATFLAAVAAAVDSVRAAGIQFAVAAPTVVPINVKLTVGVTSLGLSQVQGAVQSAIISYVLGLGVGASVSYGFLAGIIEGVGGVAFLTNFTLNGLISDVVIPANSEAIVASVTFI